MKRPVLMTYLLPLMVFILAACVGSNQSGSDLATSVSSSVPSEVASEVPTSTMTPADTELPPTPTETSLPPAFTPTTFSPPVPPAGPTLERFPAGQEIEIIEIEMFDSLAGWGIGGLGDATDHLFTTDDGGTHWADVTPPQPGSPGILTLTAFFLDSSNAWVTFSNLDTLLPSWPVVWHTSDRGLTWLPGQLLDMANLEQAFATELFFADPQNGWLLTYNGVGMSHEYVTLFRTTDGGQTWARLLDPYTDGQIQICQKTDLLFVDSQTGWLTGDCGGVMAGVFLNLTRDGGLTWTYVELPPPADNLQLFDVNTPAACGGHDLNFLDGQTILLSVRCTLYPSAGDPTFANYLYATSTGGETWSFTSYPGGTLYFLDLQTGWALSRDIYQTTDGGVTWTQLSSVNWDALFDFISLEIGWAAAYNDGERALVQTTNRGVNWSMLNPVIGP